MDSRRSSSQEAADQDRHSSSPASASSSRATRSSAGPPSSGLHLLFTAASSSGSGAPDRDPTSTAPHSCLAFWQAANAPTVHLDRIGFDLVEIRASIQAIQASLQVVEVSVARDSAVDELREEHSCLQRAHTSSRCHAAELHLQIRSAGTTAQAFSQFCQDRHDRLLHRLERANELLTLRDADVVNMEERIVHTEDRLREQTRQRVEAEALVEQLRNLVRDLESQIAALSSNPDLGSAPALALSRRLVARDRELHDLNMAHSALQQRCPALEQSKEALTEAAGQLRRQADALNRRLDIIKIVMPSYGIATPLLRIATLSLDRDSVMRDRDALVQDRGVIVSDYLRLQEQYFNAYRRMWAITAAMGQDVRLPIPSSFATYLQASSATAGRTRKSQRTDATSSAPRDVLDLRPRSPARRNCSPSGSAQIDDSMSSASDDGNRNAGSATAEINHPPELPKRPDTSPSSDSDPQKVEPEIAMQGVSDTTPPEISEPDKRESVEGKDEAEDDGTDDEILSALSRSQSSLRLNLLNYKKYKRRGSLSSDRRAPQPIIDLDGDGDSPSGSSSGNSGGDGSGGGDTGSPSQDHVGGDSAVGDLAGAALEVDEIDDSPLFPTFVPRRLWVPGVCARLFRQPDIIPWDVYVVSSLRASEIDVQALSTLLTGVSEWLLPAIDSASHPLPDSYEHLIIGATVNALMDTSPWSRMSNGEAPLTFIPAVCGRRLPHNFVQDYLELEGNTSSHIGSLPIFCRSPRSCVWQIKRYQPIMNNGTNVEAEPAQPGADF
ncbi:unnamed protein product [Phytophthora fragariaefolia]|uniref:Unnamed protein product n=1 Tax=Phytophthora fragariaefolia TaxID=1490495 RepID=A0A9W7CXK9_9STRA|nr:unnamed protein product [Phytophthora fragariaefolia]